MASDIAIVAEDIIKTKVSGWYCNTEAAERFYVDTARAIG